MVLLMLVEMIKILCLGKYGVDLLVIMVIVVILVVGEYWVSFVVLIMFIGGDLLEDYVVKWVNIELKVLFDNLLCIVYCLVVG